ncbi:MAG: hypothetical protein WC683_04775 [bacterium]
MSEPWQVKLEEMRAKWPMVIIDLEERRMPDGWWASACWRVATRWARHIQGASDDRLSALTALDEMLTKLLGNPCSRQEDPNA